MSNLMNFIKLKKSSRSFIILKFFIDLDYYDNLEKEMFNDRYRKLEQTESRQFFEVFDHKERTK